MSEIVYQILNALIGGMILGTVIMALLFFMRWKNQREAEGKILCHFFGPAGWYYLLCEHTGNSVRPPEGHKLQGSYFITTDCLYGGHWKPGQPKWAQVGVQTTAYIENVREPIVSTNPAKWIQSPDKHRITAFMQDVAINESYMKTIQAMQTGVWKDIASMAQFIKRVPIMFIISVANTAILLLCLYLNYVSMQSISTMMQRGY